VTRAGPLIIAAIVAISAIPLSAREYRSREVTREFQREHPCPSTGKTVGACPGYRKDHIRPLCSGGPDAVWNPQWQTVRDAAAKDRWERKACGRGPDPSASSLANQFRSYRGRSRHYEVTTPRRAVDDGAAWGTLYLAPLRPGHHNVHCTINGARPRLHCRALMEGRAWTLLGHAALFGWHRCIRLQPSAWLPGRYISLPLTVSYISERL
jgi:hypothetical protein